MDNERKIQREALGLTQNQAAIRAKVSHPTWRRWEEAPHTVKASTRIACEKVLAGKVPLTPGDIADAKFRKVWKNHPILTPRQAAHISSAIAWWADMSLEEWLTGGPDREPLHTVGPFNYFDISVMIHVNDNKAWASAAKDRCDAIYAELEQGILPFDRPGCLFDEVLMAAALSEAETMMEEVPELHAELATPVEIDEEGDEYDQDSDWGFAVLEGFDEAARWTEWTIPIVTYATSTLIGSMLAARHPYTWFDRPRRGECEHEDEETE